MDVIGKGITEGRVEGILLGFDGKSALGLSFGDDGGLELGCDVGTLYGEAIGSVNGISLSVTEGIVESIALWSDDESVLILPLYIDERPSLDFNYVIIYREVLGSSDSA